MENAIIVSADEIKKTFVGYSPKKVEQFHSRSAKLADKEFYKRLKTLTCSKVILLNGGTASGKTEFLMTHLIDEEAIIFDGTMSTNEGARIKIEASIKQGKNVEVYAVIPDDLKRAFIAFLNRDRKFSDDHFYKTHSNSRKSLLFVAQSYPKVKVELIESSYNLKDKLEFTKIKFDGREDLIKYIEKIQLAESAIIKSVI